MKTPKSSDNNWHWGHFLGAAPNRAKERYSLYKETKGLESIGHLAMVVLLSTPVVGGAVSLIGRVCSWASKTSSKEVDTASTSIYTQQDIEESKQNQREFIKSLDKEKSRYYCSVETIDQADFSRKTSPLSLGVEVAVNSSQTVPIEDVTCNIEVVSKTDPRIKGRLLGIFDGFGGYEVAKTAKKNIQQMFRSSLDCEKNIKEAFNKQITHLQDYCRHTQFIGQKSAALICYIDEATNIAHVLGVGNSQACIIRKIGGVEKIIPLSLPNENFIDDQNKTLQISYVAFPLKKGDVLILGSSGLFDAISVSRRIAIESNDFTAQQISDALSDKYKETNKKSILVNFSKK